MAEEYAAVKQSTAQPIAEPMAPSSDALTELLRDGARKLLAEAIEAQFAAWIEAHAHLDDPSGKRHVVPNGYLTETEIQTGLGNVAVRRPLVHDRGPDGQAIRFFSAILPPYLRRTKEPGAVDPLALPQGS